MHEVLLVNKPLGASHNVYPCSGKSGKLYGNATFDAVYACPVLRMSLEDYEKNAYDIIGNTFAGQQWVPVFKLEQSQPETPQPAAESEDPEQPIRRLLAMFTVNELRALAKKLKADTSGTRHDLMAAISEKVSTE